MTREIVDSMLKGYKFAVGRCGHLEAEIRQIEQRIEAEKHGRAAELAAVKPQQITDMPHGTQVGNPTEKFGLMLAAGWESEYAKDLQAIREKLLTELKDCELVLSFGDSWLAGLTERERWIVEQRIIEARFWRDVQTDYRRQFDEVCSKDTLKRLRARAMEKIYKMAE